MDGWMDSHPSSLSHTHSAAKRCKFCTRLITELSFRYRDFRLRSPSSSSRARPTSERKALLRFVYFAMVRPQIVAPCFPSRPPPITDCFFYVLPSRSQSHALSFSHPSSPARSDSESLGRLLARAQLARSP